MRAQGKKVTKSSITHNRLVFIDIARSIAILMMLEGHFIYMALAEHYRSEDYFFYNLWSFPRGLTAPLFFTVSGLVFTYLLVRRKTPFFKNKRVKKGGWRALKLIGWGYLLQVNFFLLLTTGSLNDYALIFHVLQCIGVSLLLIIVCYGISKTVKVVPFFIVLIVAGILVFIYKPTLHAADLSGLHPLFENMLLRITDGRDYSSLFPIFPFVGYAFLGAAVGAFASNNPQRVYTHSFVFVMMTIAFLVYFFVADLLSFFSPLFESVGWEPVAEEAYLFTNFSIVLFGLAVIIILGKHKRRLRLIYYRKLQFLRSWFFPIAFYSAGAACVLYDLLIMEAQQLMVLPTLSVNAIGQGLLFVGVILTAAKLIRWNYNLFIKMGQHTLSIYIVHMIILYASIFGVGLKNSLYRSLDPWSALVGAIAFMVFFTYFVKHIEKINRFYRGINRQLTQKKQH